MPFGFGLPGGPAPDPNDPAQMQQFLGQLQQLFTTAGEGPVNWDLARQVALASLTGAGAMNFPGFTGPPPEAPSALGDPPISAAERAAVAEALHLADLWLEPASALPSGIRTAQAWSRAEWVNSTLPVWRKLCDPVAGRMVGAMGDLVPDEMRGQLGPMQSMVATLGGALFGGQLGQALGSLAAEVLSAGDIGLPLGLAEAFRRRRAAGGPAEQTFAALVGLELRPRRLREAAALWSALTEHRGTGGRDALWGHPDLLPGDEDFADPDAFARSQLDLSSLDLSDLDKPGPEGDEPAS